MLGGPRVWVFRYEKLIEKVIYVSGEEHKRDSEKERTPLKIFGLLFFFSGIIKSVHREQVIMEVASQTRIHNRYLSFRRNVFLENCVCQS
jgi:hypothetical protein